MPASIMTALSAILLLGISWLVAMLVRSGTNLTKSLSTTIANAPDAVKQGIAMVFSAFLSIAGVALHHAFIGSSLGTLAPGDIQFLVVGGLSWIIAMVTHSNAKLAPLLTPLTNALAEANVTGTPATVQMPPTATTQVPPATALKS